MKQLILTTLSLFILGPIWAGTSPTTAQKLSKINSFWQQQPLAVKSYANTFYIQGMSDHQLIQLHLQLVETVLRNKNTIGLSEQQYSNRINSLNHLHAYWTTNMYPINNKTPQRNPVFIDDYNTFCAVGYLIKTSGQEHLARKIAAEQNLSYLMDIKTAGLSDWIQNSGFTPEELAWIQPGYIAVNNSRPLGNGVNGSVNALTGNESTKTLYVGGSFTLADSSVVCNNIVAVNYSNDIFNNTFTPLGEGLNGPVNALFSDGNNLYAGGDFDSSGNTPVHNIAKWNGNVWEAMGELNGTVNCISKYKNQIVVGGLFTFIDDGHIYQNLAYWNGSTWKPFNSYMNGEVNTLVNYWDMLVVGGAFTQIDTTQVNYVCAYLDRQLVLLGEGLKTPVNTLSVDGGVYLYAAGPIVKINNDTTYGLAKCIHPSQWNNNLIMGYFYGFHYDSSSYISTISSNYMAGKFRAGQMYMSSNTGIIKNDEFSGFASPDGPVSTILPLGKRVFFGGLFNSIWCGTTNGRGMQFTANNLGVWDPDYVGLRTVDPVLDKFTISPNPTRTETTIAAQSAIKSVCIYDLSGKKVWDQTCPGTQYELTLPRSIFPSSGIYFIQLYTQSGQPENQKILVE